MKPVLKINDIKNLHDARYCAAVGISALTFRIESSMQAGLSPVSVKEITEWLSGPQAIGEFGAESADEISGIAGSSGIHWVMLPESRFPAVGTSIQVPVIFRFNENATPEYIAEKSSEILGTLPDSLFEFSLSPDVLLTSDNLPLEKSFLRYNDPDKIYGLLEKNGKNLYGFSLGTFVEEPDGLLDYETCDEFIEHFKELVPV